MAKVMDTIELEKRLTRFLDAQMPGRKVSVQSLTALAGGYSRVTHRAEVLWDDRTAQQLLLRADPVDGSTVFDSNRDEEWSLLVALDKVEQITIPTPLWYDASGEYFDAKCMVVEFCEGVSLQSQIDGGSDLDTATKTIAEIAAQIHSVPIDALGKQMSHPTNWDDYIDSIIDIFDSTERSIGESIPALRYVPAWLRSHRPEPVPLTLVHGDFQPTNVLMTPTGERLLIDWEFGRIGDPREDLGYYFQWPMPPNLIKRDPDALLAHYRSLTGLSESQVNIEVVHYFLMVGMARLLSQIVKAVDRLDQGRGGGAMTTYLINTISYQCNEYLQNIQSQHEYRGGGAA